MKPDLVADIGNTRIKWGRCERGEIAQLASLPPEDQSAWELQTEQWNLPTGLLWAIAGVHPQRRDHLIDWVRQRGDQVWLLDTFSLLPLHVELPHPDKAGIDRLLNAVAVNRLRASNRAAVIVDAGSAVTVDLVDAKGTFRGGAILPGFRLMSQALHDYTALLPLVKIEQIPAPLGSNTVEAIQAGIFCSIVGGIQGLVGKYALASAEQPELYLTGGNGVLIGTALSFEGMNGTYLQTLTLEGIRLTATSH